MDEVNMFDLPNAPRPYYCTNCGYFQLLTTNHTASCLNFCDGCSWKPAFGDPRNRYPMRGHIYRRFMYTEDSMDSTTLQLYIVGLRERGFKLTDAPQPYGRSVEEYIREHNSVAAYIRERSNQDIGDLLETAAFMLKDLDALVEMLEGMRRYMTPVNQDGANFYAEKDGKLLASYPALVKDEHDIEGAKAARHQFLTEFPGCYFETGRNLPRTARDMKNGKATIN